MVKDSGATETCTEDAFASPGSLNGTSISKTRVWPGNRVKSSIPSSKIVEVDSELASEISESASSPASTSTKATFATSNLEAEGVWLSLAWCFICIVRRLPSNSTRIESSTTGAASGNELDVIESWAGQVWPAFPSSFLKTKEVCKNDVTCSSLKPMTGWSSTVTSSNDFSIS